MTHLLHVDSSVFGLGGQSAQLSDAFVKRWMSQHPDTIVTQRDLAGDPVPHLDATAFSGFTSPAEERSPEQIAAVRLSEELIAEMRVADVIVLGMPMYNMGVPSTFKSWIDHVARAGETFRYTENGPEGLLAGKKVYVLAARGGQYLDTPNDTQTPYIRTILGLMGITDITFINAEGLAMGDEVKSQAITAAHARIIELIPANAAAENVAA